MCVHRDTEALFETLAPCAQRALATTDGNIRSLKHLLSTCTRAIRPAAAAAPGRSAHGSPFPRLVGAPAPPPERPCAPERPSAPPGSGPCAWLAGCRWQACGPASASEV